MTPSFAKLETASGLLVTLGIVDTQTTWITITKANEVVDLISTVVIIVATVITVYYVIKDHRGKK